MLAYAYIICATFSHLSNIIVLSSFEKKLVALLPVDLSKFVTDQVLPMPPVNALIDKLINPNFM